MSENDKKIQNIQRVETNVTVNTNQVSDRDRLFIQIFAIILTIVVSAAVGWFSYNFL